MPPSVIVPPPPKLALSVLEVRFVEHLYAARDKHSPYVWTGKGDVLWTLNGLVKNPFGTDVFDCSGLITTALQRAGGPDLRASHGSRQMFEQFPVWGSRTDDTEKDLRLRFYPGHVALFHALRWNGRIEVIEAAGGGKQTTAPTPGAMVRQGLERRDDFMGERSLSGYLRQLGFA